MGIESDQLVFDYLSRVGDLAQQRQLPSATRMRLVTELRGEIDRRRAKTTVDSPAAVRRILEHLGSPDRIVTGAQEGGSGAADPAAPLVRPVPEQPTGKADRTGGLRRRVPRPRRASAPEPAVPDDVPSPPHLAGSDELGVSGDVTDWWRMGDGASGSLTDIDSVPGFVGGVEIPDMLKPPKARENGPDLRKRPSVPVEDDEPEDEKGAEPAGPGKGDRAKGVRRLRRTVVPSGGLTNPFLLLSAAALVVGAVLGNILVLLAGWAVVFLSRRLTDFQKKVAVFGLPGLAVAGGVVWLWGRSAGKWGAGIAEGQMSGAFQETWPWVLRCAAIASALYLLWRSQRTRF
ncbi:MULTISPECIES: hypothetical protein [unclassified Streptomyces]|uniref:hypothetical protein n=1 Tax=unclassified Streptomyces TaxID=2593676 RepID=UPI000DBAC5AB|nr:hypothetical protein [Streptomyces sp. PsTaAH-137]MYT72185.1 hypothetical protein [Streptomyces sp. SID8367]RAJ81596.1 hypothetical protein K377_04614 [Streptomyces sp. PsTaAH-137]